MEWYHWIMIVVIIVCVWRLVKMIKDDINEEREEK